MIDYPLGFSGLGHAAQVGQPQGGASAAAPGSPGGWMPGSSGAGRAVAPAGPYVSSPGLKPGEAQPQLSSLNQSGPGTGESYYANNQGIWQSPSFGETNTQGVVNHYSDPSNRPALTQNSQNWFQQYTGAMPNIATDPGLAPYYNNAEKRSTEGINQAVAARGAYGSSAANDQISRGITDLEADKANREADYNLRRIGEQRAWQGLGGQLAGQADSQSQAASQDAQNWAGLLSKLGLDASGMGLNRTNAGMDAASSAQSQQRNRGNDYFSQQQSQGDRLAELYKNIMLPGLDNDAAMMENASSGGVAEGNQAAANEQQNAQNTINMAKEGAGAYQFGKGNGWW